MLAVEERGVFCVYFIHTSSRFGVNCCIDGKVFTKLWRWFGPKRHQYRSKRCWTARVDR